MKTIEIRNIGPIKEARFDLNEVNVFMGPQSSGKSTIAKVISYCAWVEKDVATSQSLKKYQEDKTLFKSQLEDFHKIKGYFRPDSYLSYCSDVIDIRWENGQGAFGWVDQFAYQRSKISYIPSDRNMIALPEVRKVTFNDTNVRSFLFDWFDARKKYPQDKKISLLDLEVDYYYSEGSDEDHVAGVSGDIKYDILLSNASSGLQSITPLVLMIDYLTSWIYKEDIISFEQEEKRRKANTILLNEVNRRMRLYGEGKPSDTMDETFMNLFHDDLAGTFSLSGISKLQDDLFSTKNVQFILEEPEQNLFPETQRALVYYLLERCFNQKENRLTITTHSPYILYALNNCMMGGLVDHQLTDVDEKKSFLDNEFLSEKSWINPQSVSVWEIDNGEIRSIQDKDNIISENYFDKKMTELTDEYYQMLYYYRDEE